MRYALIQGERVQNVIDASPEFAASIASEWDAVVPTFSAGIGWAWTQSGGFVAPDGSTPPPDPENPEDPPAPFLPITVSRRQGRQALLLAGLLDAVQPVINGIEDQLEREMMQIWWNDATEFDRSNTALLALAGALGLSEGALDALFTQAAAL